MLLDCEWLTVDECVDGGIWHNYELKEAILLQFDLAVVLLDSCGTDDDVRLRCACLAADKHLTLGQRVVLDARHLGVLIQVDHMWHRLVILSGE